MQYENKLNKTLALEFAVNVKIKEFIFNVEGHCQDY